VISPTLQFDEQASRRVEATYKTPDVVAQREHVLAALALEPGERVIDVGSGPGLLACQMAAVVGPTGAVIGVDASDSMLALANARRPPAGSAAVEFKQAMVDALPFPDASFDVAVSTQVYEYVQDVPRALTELHRLLRPGGRVVILDTDWDSIVCHSRDPGLTARVLAAWEEHLVDPRLPRRLRRMLVDCGFALGGCEVVPLLNVGYDRNTYSAGMMELVAEFIAGRAGVSAQEAATWLSDLVALGEDYFFSLNRYLFTAVRS
jgi:SAM-dependent methyltransferase